jgi:signal transduction histidine kinase
MEKKTGKTPEQIPPSPEMLRQIASMICHDLNNPMQVILGTLYMEKETIDALHLPPEERRKMEYFCERIAGEVEYMKELTSEIKDWIAPLKPEIIETSLMDLIKDTISKISVPEKVRVDLGIDESSRVLVDQYMMRRVFTNMITNAIDAMPDGGDLLIKVSKTDNFLQISVEDTGIGIPEENFDKLFIPFFTTKSKGTGLGLPICKRMVDAHSGSIEVHSKVGQGTKFTISMKIGDKVGRLQQADMDNDKRLDSNQLHLSSTMIWNRFMNDRRPVSSLRSMADHPTSYLYECGGRNGEE